MGGLDAGQGPLRPEAPAPDFFAVYAPPATGAAWIVPKRHVERVGDDGHGARVAESCLGLIVGHLYPAPYEDLRRGSSAPLSALHFEERAQSAVEGRSAARHQASLEHLEDLLARGAEADRALHVRHEAGAIRTPEGQERDGDELADLRRDVLTLPQPQLVDAVVTTAAASPAREACSWTGASCWTTGA